MLQASTYLQFELNPGEVIALSDTANCELECVNGQVWVTEENGHEDIGLAAGDHHHLTHPGQTVVVALDDSAVTQCRLILAPTTHDVFSLTHRIFPSASDAAHNCRWVMGELH